MINPLLITIGKTLSLLSRAIGKGAGSTWPGHIALSINKDFINQITDTPRPQVILVAGTNGKTTTSRMIQTILETNGKKVFQNAAGANLLNGIASSLISHSSIFGTLDYDYAIFEIDENTIPLVIKECRADYVVLLNLFRDQLDRYGEVNKISKNWKKALGELPKDTTLIVNADDPEISYLGQTAHTQAYFFGLQTGSKKELGHAVDSTYCPHCGTKLKYSAITFSHLGIWECPNCNLKRPGLYIEEFSYYPMTGTYNEYNTLAAVALCKKLGLSDAEITNGLKQFTPAFGRQEKIEVDGKNIQLFLSKNPTGFNESLRTVLEQKGKNLLLVLNDRIPDGTDVSWIWDFDLEEYLDNKMNVTVSGDRTYDIALRVKYADIKDFTVEVNLEGAIKKALEKTATSETLYILPTYSAMLEVRKILVGRKLL